ncbi:MAG: MFS transporter [Actinomycetota bacterium]|nr:MFS transporter [Actinomycetota bacterium]
MAQARRSREPELRHDGDRPNPGRGNGSPPEGGRPEGTPDGEVPTRPVPHLAPAAARTATVRLFGSHDFFRLWLAQVVSALGDWIGFLALLAIAERIGGAGAIGVVMTARILPGFFLAPLAGVLLDRWNRKRVMVGCDVGRAVVLLALPLVDSIFQLVVLSFLLEVLTVMWSPAKEAEVPNMVPAGHLATANSLSMVAAYGSIPVAAGLFAGLAKVADVLSRQESLAFLDEASLAVYFDVVTFLLSAVLISTLRFGDGARATTAPGTSTSGTSTSRRADRGGVDLRGTLRDFKEGWQFVASNRTVAAVMVGMGAGLIGGGMLVPLGPLFTEQVLGGGTAGFGLVVFALGMGVAVGVVAISVLNARFDKPRTFTTALVAAGVALLLGASMSTLIPALALVAILGAGAGCAYVLGYTILQEGVSDDLRGRTFTALYTVVRLCLLIAFAVGPFLAGALGRLSDRLSEGEVSLGGLTISTPGVRLTLWLAAVIIVVAGVLAGRVLREGESRAPEEVTA